MRGCATLPWTRRCGTPLRLKSRVGHNPQCGQSEDEVSSIAGARGKKRAGNATRDARDSCVPSQHFGCWSDHRTNNPDGIRLSDDFWLHLVRPRVRVLRWNPHRCLGIHSTSTPSPAREKRATNLTELPVRTAPTDPALGGSTLTLLADSIGSHWGRQLS